MSGRSRPCSGWRAGLIGAAILAGFGMSAAATAATEPAVLPEDSGAAMSAYRTWVTRALAGDALAAYKLGQAYLDGASRPEDRVEAARWLRRAAVAGHGAARFDLALLYAKGLGLPQDYVRSYAWFDLAAATLEPSARREQALELRAMMGAFLTPAQRDEARRLAERWMLEAIR